MVLTSELIFRGSSPFESLYYLNFRDCMGPFKVMDYYPEVLVLVHIEAKVTNNILLVSNTTILYNII